jgi:bisphosphoglycerate-independent phosphoglycerate mutase (AlkP superfamily)
MLLEKKENLGPVVLLLLDGWGVAPAGEGNAIAQAQTPVFKDLAAKYPTTILMPPPLAIAKNKVSIPNNYSAIGTGKKKATKDDLSIFDYLDSARKKWLVLADPEKIAYGAFFVNNKKKIKSENIFVAVDKSSKNSTEVLIAELLKKIKSHQSDFILAILSNLDMAAHNGNFQSTVEAAEMIDKALNKIVKAVLDNSGVLLISSSHGNAEEAIEMPSELKNKQDTDNPVPLIIAGRQFEGKSFGFQEAPGSDLSLVPPSGSLIDIAPTILKIMNIDLSKYGFDGKSLI